MVSLIWRFRPSIPFYRGNMSTLFQSIMSMVLIIPLLQDI